MATKNAVNNGLSGSTGTGNFVGDNAPTITSPVIKYTNGDAILDPNGNEIVSFNYVASAVNLINFVNSATGNAPIIAPFGSDTNITLKLNGVGTGGVTLEGTATNDEPGAGYVGETVHSNIPAASAVNIPHNTATDITSISLTAGDWDVWGNINITFSGTGSNASAWVSTTSATVPDNSYAGAIVLVAPAYISVGSINAPSVRVLINSTTPVYLTAFASIAAGTAAGCGNIFARRRR